MKNKRKNYETTEIRLSSPYPGDNAESFFLSTPGLYLDSTPDISRDASRIIFYEENKSPLSNGCTATQSVTLPSSLPSVTWSENNLWLTRKTSETGVVSIADWWLSPGASHTITGLPRNRIRCNSRQPSRDEKTAYCQLFSGGAGDDMGGLVLQLLELKDMPQLLNTVKDFIKFLTSIRKRPWSATKTVKDIASAYLATKFGVLPTLQQIEFFCQTLWSEMETFESAVKRLKDSAATRFSNELLSVRQNILLGRPSVYDVDGLQALWLEPVTLTRTYHVERGWDNEPHHVQLFNYLNSVCETRFGHFYDEWLLYAQFEPEVFLEVSPWDVIVNLFWEIIRPFENLWAIFPLSFVVDWFISVDKTFERVDAILRHATCGFKPFDGIWRSRRARFALSTNLPSAVRPSYSVTEISEDVDGFSFKRALSVNVTYEFGGPAIIDTDLNGFIYKREPIVFSKWDLLLPTLPLNINVSKSVTLAALIAQFTVK